LGTTDYHYHHQQQHHYPVTRGDNCEGQRQRRSRAKKAREAHDGVSTCKKYRDGWRVGGRKGGILYFVDGDGSMVGWMNVAALAGWRERKESARRRTNAEKHDSDQFKYPFLGPCLSGGGGGGGGGGRGRGRGDA